MNDKTLVGVLLLAVIIVAVATSVAYQIGHKQGQRNERCRQQYAVATTATDSLVISRSDARCAAQIQLWRTP